MFRFFKSSPLQSYDFLGTDMHAHFLPGIDDGAPDLASSLDLIGRMSDMGYHTLWATPHVMADLYPNTPAIIEEKLALVRQAVKEAGIAVELHAAAEYLLDEAFGEKIANKELLTLPGNRVLVEMSFVAPPPQLDTYLFQLQAAGYQVVLAHPERYLFYHQNIKQYQAFVDKGCELQVNLLSLSGYYGKPIKETAKTLLKKGWVSFLGTDLHHRRHAEMLRQLVKKPSCGKLLNKYKKGIQNTAL